MNKCLVTGGAGMIASHLTDHLVKGGNDVVVLDDLSGGFIENINPEADFVNGSILDHKMLKDLFEQEKFDYVYHLAAYAAEGLSPFIKRYNYMNNVVGTCNLINESVNNDVKKFVFLSSIAVYGGSRPPFSEDSFTAPIDSYGVAKTACEDELVISHEFFDLDYVIFRPHNVYGPRQNIGDKYRNVVGIFMNQIMKGEPITIFGTGEQERAFTYVEDITPIISHSVHQDLNYNVYNIGSNEVVNVNTLAYLVMEVMGKKVPVNHVGTRHEAFYAYSDHTRLLKDFHNNFTSLQTGLERMAEWAREHGTRETKDFTDIEITKNLPEVWK